MLFRWYPKAIPGRDLSVVPAERAVRWKGCGLTKAETLLSHHLLELPVEQTLGLLPELVPPAERLLSLPLHTWPQPATETCYPPVLKLNLCMVLKDRIRGFFPWNQPLQAAVLYLIFCPSCFLLLRKRWGRTPEHWSPMSVLCSCPSAARDL